MRDTPEFLSPRITCITCIFYKQQMAQIYVACRDVPLGRLGLSTYHTYRVYFYKQLIAQISCAFRNVHLSQGDEHRRCGGGM